MQLRRDNEAIITIVINNQGKVKECESYQGSKILKIPAIECSNLSSKHMVFKGRIGGIKLEFASMYRKDGTQN